MTTFSGMADEWTSKITKTKIRKRHFTALACFYGFSCCDASLRHEGCCFSVVGLPKLASKHADNREATKGAAIASQQVFCWFWSKIIWMSVNPYLYENINSIIHYNLGWRIDEVGKRGSPDKFCGLVLSFIIQTKKTLCAIVVLVILSVWMSE